VPGSFERSGHLPSPHCSSCEGHGFRARLVGAHVEAGQLLASIYIPNLDQQFAQAKADLATATAAAQLGAVTAEPWNASTKSQWASRQPTNCKTGAAAAKKVAMHAASAM
jgi:multidrug efflux pump subunit AcrA (membrane-fusion protein)